MAENSNIGSGHYVLDISKKQTEAAPTIIARVGDWGIHDQYSFQLTNHGTPLTDIVPGSLTFEAIAPGTFDLKYPKMDTRPGHEGEIVHITVFYEVVNPVVAGDYVLDDGTDTSLNLARTTYGNGFFIYDVVTEDDAQQPSDVGKNAFFKVWRSSRTGRSRRILDEAIDEFGLGNFIIMREMDYNVVSERRLIIDDTGFSEFDTIANDGSFTYTFPAQCFAMPGTFENAYFAYTTENGRSSTISFKITVMDNVDIKQNLADGLLAQYQSFIDDTSDLTHAIEVTLAEALNDDDIAKIQSIESQIEDINEYINGLDLPDFSEYITATDAEDIIGGYIDTVMPQTVLDSIKDGTFNIANDKNAAMYFTQSRYENDVANYISVANSDGIEALLIRASNAIYYNDNSNGNIYEDTTTDVFVDGTTLQGIQSVQINKTGQYKLIASLGFEDVNLFNSTLQNPNPFIGFEAITVRNTNSGTQLFRHDLGEYSSGSPDMMSFSTEMEVSGTVMLYAIQQGDRVILIKRGNVSNGNLITRSFSLEQV